MSVLLVALGLLLVSLPGIPLLPADRLDPREWARVACATVRVGSIALRLGLFLGAAPTLLRALGVEHAADVCHQMFGPLAPGGAPVGYLSAAMFVVLVVAHERAGEALRLGFERAEVESWLGEHELVDGIDVVTLVSAHPVAYAVPRGGGQIVISSCLVELLEPHELDAVLAHERSHLCNGHQRHLLWAGSLERSLGFFGPARRTARCLRLAVERWADEDASDVSESRQVVQAALVKTAERLTEAALAFTSGCTIVSRLDALEADRPRPRAHVRMMALTPLVLGTVVTLSVLGAWATYSHHGVLGVLGFCPA